MPDAAWKRAERAIAQRLGGRRVGPSGRNTEDVAHPWLSVECKERRALPGWLKAAVVQARANAPADRLAIVVLHELGTRHDGDLVVLRFGDFEEWFNGNLQGEEETQVGA